ncbi:hypoxanthine-guanine phosphoribosyltransferase [Ceratobasidium sp. AG-Ba]|nr:hypoxanthine-guanine phosphoribosyltransferase [Ceratobasidium sp. AG-Ba]
MSQEHDGHLRATYNEIHMLIGASAARIEKEFAPDLFVAIGGGGFFPARVLRTFLKHPQSQKNISIQAIGLSLYEELPSTTEEQMANEVIRTQWLGPETKTLLGRRVLIVDEVDDSRTTLQYAVRELQKDVEKELLALPESEREAMRPKFAVFVVHNKLKPKKGSLPPDVPYFAGEEIEDVWFDYPWEVRDVYEHDRMAELGRKLQGSKP